MYEILKMNDKQEVEIIGYEFEEGEALKAACTNNTVCMEPITIYEIKNNKIKLVEER